MNEINSAQTPHDLAKIRTGIDGFDEITGGGLPLNRTTIVMGGPGAGKTVLGLQTLVNAAKENMPGVFVAFEEPSHQIIANAHSFGWKIPELITNNKLFFIDAHLDADVVQSGKFDLAGLLAMIMAKAKEIGAKLVVFDSVDVLLTLINDPFAERRESYRLRDWLSQSGLSGLICARIAPESPSTLEHFGFMVFMADCVIMIQQQITDGLSLRQLRISKYRGSSFKENEFPFIIGSQGIIVARLDQENLVAGSAAAPESVRRSSSGIEPLDDMLSGGYLQGASILITGAPGTGKSILAGLFTESACRRGEKTLYVSFDKPVKGLLRDLASSGVSLSRYIECGLLEMYSAYTSSLSAAEYLIRLKETIRQLQPRCIVIDPLSIPLRVGSLNAGRSIAEQLLHAAWDLGITIFFTSFSREINPVTEESISQISPLVDTWIHLTHGVCSEDRRRALTIIKSRGTRHASQSREFLIGDNGIELTNVLSGESEAGVIAAKLEHESGANKQKWIEAQRCTLERAAAVTRSQLKSIQDLLDAQNTALALLLSRQNPSKEQELNVDKDSR